MSLDDPRLRLGDLQLVIWEAFKGVTSDTSLPTPAGHHVLCYYPPTSIHLDKCGVSNPQYECYCTFGRITVPLTLTLVLQPLSKHCENMQRGELHSCARDFRIGQSLPNRTRVSTARSADAFVRGATESAHEAGCWCHYYNAPS